MSRWWHECDDKAERAKTGKCYVTQVTAVCDVWGDRQGEMPLKQNQLLQVTSGGVFFDGDEWWVPCIATEDEWIQIPGVGMKRLRRAGLVRCQNVRPTHDWQ